MDWNCQFHNLLASFWHILCLFSPILSHQWLKMQTIARTNFALVLYVFDRERVSRTVLQVWKLFLLLRPLFKYFTESIKYSSFASSTSWIPWKSMKVSESLKKHWKSRKSLKVSENHWKSRKSLKVSENHWKFLKVLYFSSHGQALETCFESRLICKL